MKLQYKLPEIILILRNLLVVKSIEKRKHNNQVIERTQQQECCSKISHSDIGPSLNIRHKEARL